MKTFKKIIADLILFSAFLMLLFMLSGCDANKMWEALLIMIILIFIVLAIVWAIVILSE